MPTPFPHRYRSELEWKGTSDATLLAPPRPGIVGGSPPEFDGCEDHWSPEHLLMGSVNLCFLLTLRAGADRKGLALRGVSSDVEGVVEKTKEGLRFTHVTIRCEVEVAPDVDVDSVRDLVQAAKRHCLISNSMHAEIDVEGHVIQPA